VRLLITCETGQDRVAEYAGQERIVPNSQIAIRTRDGDCPLHVATPADDGPWPAVIFNMDADGIRPVVIEMAQRLAGAGYIVLLPDLFYRCGPYAPLVPKEVFAGNFRAILGPMMATTGNDKAAEDTEAFLAYVDTRGDVAGCKVGAVGFCMGGGMALAAAGTYPDRFGAVASFHGGNLATDAPGSPHGEPESCGLYCRCRERWQLPARDGRAI
jgi:carboxymethylenebutenolidase